MKPLPLSITFSLALQCLSSLFTLLSHYTIQCLVFFLSLLPYLTGSRRQRHYSILSISKGIHGFPPLFSYLYPSLLLYSYFGREIIGFQYSLPGLDPAMSFETCYVLYFILLISSISTASIHSLPHLPNNVPQKFHIHVNWYTTEVYGFVCWIL